MMEIGSRILLRKPGLILTGIVENVFEDSVHVRIESPWGQPNLFAEWFLSQDLIAVE